MYRIALCDDDMEYMQYLENKIKIILKDSEQYLICKYLSGEEFLNDLDNSFDLVVLDMQMGKIDGITAALKFRKQNQEAVLFFCKGLQLTKTEFFYVNPFMYLINKYYRENG